MSDENFEELNFWPAFSDMMMAVILVLLLVLGAVYLLIGEGVKRAEDCENEFATGLPDAKKIPNASPNTWKVLDKDNSNVLITLQQDAHDKLLLHITFSDSVLFKKCDAALLPDGRPVLEEIGESIRRQLSSIVEIEILGHADRTPPVLSSACKFGDNLHLASARADSVFLFLQKEMQIDPIEHAMSATSYGEFFPSSREPGKPYSPKEWEEANSTEILMQRNRRVELILRYGTKMGVCGARK